MGAIDFERLISGKDLEEAFRTAVDADLYEFGHDPYSGDIGQKSGVFEIPTTAMPRTRTQRWTDFRGEKQSRTLPPHEVLAQLIRDAYWAEDTDAAVDELARYIPRSHIMKAITAAEDKWGNPIAIELTGAAKKAAKERLRINGTRKRVWLVIGSAAS